ncbi:hypothetical protein HYX12_02820 [Candidatus Woesearchaeota archaeon]|nr:hypothetical protein [Candidatus Woesearchaeota archaeon]
MRLLPSLKSRKRYIVFEIISEKKCSFPEVKEEVDSALLLFLGQLGLSKACPLLLNEPFSNNQFILKVNHNYTDEVKSAVILIKSIKNTPVIIRSITTSGTIKKASSRSSQ